MHASAQQQSTQPQLQLQQPTHQNQTSSYPQPHIVQFSSKAQGYELDDEDEEDERLGRVQRGVTPDGYYEDIYGQYAQMEPTLHDSATPYAMMKTGGQGGATGISKEDLKRKQSTSNRTDKTTSSSILGLWGRKRSNSNSDVSGGMTGKAREGTAAARHQRGMPSVERALPLSSPAARRFGWIPSTWPARLFLFVTLCEAAADISIEAVLLSRFRQQQGSISVNGGNLSALPVFLMVFGMAHVYQCFLAVDSIVNRNTILVFGLVLFNLAFLIYALIQITEIRDVLGNGVIPGTSQTVPVQVLTGAIPVIIGISSFIFAVLAWFLWKEFGWQIYKTIGADRKLKRAHLHFQIFVCLLKFDFFTFIAFCLQLVLVVLSKNTAEFWVTTFAAPVTLFLLVFAWWSVRMEVKWGTVAFMIASWGGAGYFTYKLYRIWQERLGPYKDVYKSLTVFSVLALALLLATFIGTIRCMMNFDMGLKGAMTRSAQERKQLKQQDAGPVISAPFQYDDIDTPYLHDGNPHLGRSGHSVPMTENVNGLALEGGDTGRGAGHGYHASEGTGYYEPYNTPLPNNLSSQGLLSPTRSPPGLMPLKSSSTLHLERSNSHQNHRLSLD